MNIEQAEKFSEILGSFYCVYDMIPPEIFIHHYSNNVDVFFTNLVNDAWLDKDDEADFKEAYKQLKGDI